jgi:hypothetical protein
MKLRIRGNSIRLRMDRRDISELLGRGHTGDEIRFGAGEDQALSYSVRLGPAPHNRPQVEFATGRLLVTIDPVDAETWRRTDDVGFDHEQLVDRNTVLRVLVEKDFACIDRPAGEELDDAFAFPNPSGGVC